MRTLRVATLLLLTALASLAQASDEPGAEDLTQPPPTATPDVTTQAAATIAPPDSRALRGGRPYWVRVELAGGLSSLVIDPDVGAGYGGGLALAVRAHPRFEVGVAASVGINPYKGLLGDAGTLFFAGQSTLGFGVHVLPLDWPVELMVEAGGGGYLVYPPLQGFIWSLGFYGGISFTYRPVRWFGIGVRVRYHLFNIATLAGQEMRDLESLRTVGLIDRLELPGTINFYF